MPGSGPRAPGTALGLPALGALTASLALAPRVGDRLGPPELHWGFRRWAR